MCREDFRRQSNSWTEQCILPHNRSQCCLFGCVGFRSAVEVGDLSHFRSYDYASIFVLHVCCSANDCYLLSHCKVPLYFGEYSTPPATIRLHRFRTFGHDATLVSPFQERSLTTLTVWRFRIDENPITYNSRSEADLWIISFNYAHSIHEVIIELAAASSTMKHRQHMDKLHSSHCSRNKHNHSQETVAKQSWNSISPFWVQLIDKPGRAEKDWSATSRRQVSKVKGFCFVLAVVSCTWRMLRALSLLENANKLDDAPKTLDDEEIEVRRRCKADERFFRYWVQQYHCLFWLGK